MYPQVSSAFMIDEALRSAVVDEGNSLQVPTPYTLNPQGTTLNPHPTPSTLSTPSLTTPYTHNPAHTLHPQP